MGRTLKPIELYILVNLTGLHRIYPQMFRVTSHTTAHDFSDPLSLTQEAAQMLGAVFGQISNFPQYTMEKLSGRVVNMSRPEQRSIYSEGSKHYVIQSRVYMCITTL
jgi:hypothetical protein